NSENYGGIWRGLPGSMQLMMRRGMQAPGLPSCVKLGFGSSDTGVGKIGVNDAGDVVFYSVLYGNGVNAPSIWVASNAGLALVAKQGDPAPGTGTVFQGFNDPVINGQGKVAFLGRLGPTTFGVFTGTPGHLV